MKILKPIFQKEHPQKSCIREKFYENNSKLIDSVENQFDIEKELLLALMGIETNFGTYVGKWIFYLH